MTGLILDVRSAEGQPKRGGMRARGGVAADRALTARPPAATSNTAASSIARTVRVVVLWGMTVVGASEPDGGRFTLAAPACTAIRSSGGRGWDAYGVPQMFFFFFS